MEVPSAQDVGAKGDVKAVWTNKWGIVPAIRPIQAAEELIRGSIQWESIPYLSDFRTLGSGTEARLVTQIQIACDRDCLYIRVIAVLPGGERSCPQERLEQIDLLLSPRAAGDEYVQIPVRFSNRKTEEEAGLNLLTNWDTIGPIKWRKPLVEQDYQLEINRTELGWEALVIISFHSLGVEYILPGTEWRFNAIRYQEGDEPVSSWVPLLQSYYMDNAINTKPDELRNYVVGYNAAGQGRMGSLLFLNDSYAGQVEEGIVNSGGEQMWEPERFDLRYIDHHEKELSFDDVSDSEECVKANVERRAALQIRWRQPSGRMVDAEVTQLKWEEVEVGGGSWIARFLSPPLVESGMIQLHLRFMPQGKGGVAYCGIVAFEEEALIAAGNEVIRSSGQADVDPFCSTEQADGVAHPSQRVEHAPASAIVKRVMAIMPAQPGFLFTGVPHDPLTRTDAVYTFNPDKPDQLVSVKDSIVYPNEQYVENRRLVVHNSKGEEVVYPYHEGEDGRRYFITAHLWYEQKRYALSATKEIALTDPLGAARLLYQWVKLYDGYVPVNDYIWRNYPVHASRTMPYPYWGGIMARWFCLELYELTPIIETYAIIRDSNAFEMLSRETGEDVEHRFVNDLLLKELAFVTSYVVINGNLDYLIWLGYIRLGKALREPDLIHRAVRLMKQFYESQFLADGFWNEVSLSYHEQSVHGFQQAIKELNGWSDPVGYLSPRNGLRFDKLDLQGLFPGLAQSITLGRLLTYPDGKYIPLGDTWASDELTQPSRGASSVLLPSVRVAKLAAGAGVEQSQAVLHFSPKYGHHHADPLGLIMYAKGKELLPDIGYTYTRHRLLYVSTFAHNTVVVDGRDMACNSGLSRHGGNVMVFAPVEQSFQIVKASQESAYPKTEQYTRELWWIGFEGAADEEGYLVDLFRVVGGRRHEYTLNGAANVDARWHTEIQLTDYGPYLVPPGTLVVEPATEYDYGHAGGEYYGYMYMQDVKRAEVKSGKYGLTLITEDGTSESAKLNITGFVEPGGNELFVGKSSSLRTTRTGGPRNKKADINDQLTQYFLPKFVLRREGEGHQQLSSTFVTVMEPYTGAEPRIKRIEQLNVESVGQGNAAVAITYENVTDYVLSSNDSDAPMVVGDMLLQGRMGFIRVKDGRVSQLRLIGGTRLRIGDTAIVGSGPLRGTVIGTTRKANGDEENRLITAEPVPHKMNGQHIVVTHPDGQTCGHRITAISTYRGGSQLAIEYDPGFEIGEDGVSGQCCYPHLKWQGEHRYCIDNIETWVINKPAK